MSLSTGDLGLYMKLAHLNPYSNGTSIGSVIFVELTIVSNRQRQAHITETHTHRLCYSCSNRQHPYVSDVQ